jgi:hypothetical protein
MNPASPSVSDSFRATLDLFQTGVDVIRQNLVRRHPDATPTEIDRLVQAWLHERPGAEAGDCPGRPVDITRLR